MAGPTTWLRTSTSDVRALDAWCEAVGPVHAHLGEARTAAPPIDALYVLTWNVHAGGGELTRLVADLRAGALTGGRPARDFVLLLQETHRGGPAVPAAPPSDRGANAIAALPPSGERLDVVEVARRLGLNVLYAPSMRNGEGETGTAEDRGNAILTSLPIEAPAAIELPLERQRRGAVAATVQGTTTAGASWSLRLVSAHLENRSRWSRALDSFGAARARQARALAAAVDDGTSVEAAVVGADLNTWSAGFLESAVEILRERFPDGPVQSEATMSVAGLPRTLDHLLFRLPDGWEATLARVDNRYGSDHHPLLGLVRPGE